MEPEAVGAIGNKPRDTEIQRLETEETDTKTVGFRGRVSQSHWTKAVGANYCESETVGVRGRESQRQGESEILGAKTLE